MSTGGGKRAFESTAADSASNKKLKSDNNGPMGGVPGGMTPAQLIAQKLAEIEAKKRSIAALSSGHQHQLKVAAPIPQIPLAPPSLPSHVVYTATPSPSVISSGPTPASGAGTPTVSDDLVRRVAEAKRRVADAQSKLAIKDNPYMSLAPQKRNNNNKTSSSTAPPPEQTQQGAGLKMAAHPLLLDTTPAVPQSKKDRYKPMQPKFASIKANTRNQPTPQPAAPMQGQAAVGPSPAANPYTSGGGGGTGKEMGAFEGAPRERAGKKFHFVPKGKYTALGNQMRQDIQLEALKQRIAESARKAGMDGDLGVEKAIKRAPPPEAEWWDAALLPNKTYHDVSTLGLERLNIRNGDSPVTIYIQHPIPIPPADEKDKVALKPMMLTKKEQKKMRKLRRKAELQEKRDRIRMGLLPPDPPKVRLSNMMKVLTADTVQDPTRVEAKVRREVAMRRHTHEKMNAERKLTDEQRREKVETKKADEDRKGIWGAVFKINTLSDPSHQFKVRKNADQLNLTGLCIFNPGFSMVYVEGASKFIRNYKKLMMHRIGWTEAARPRREAEEEVEVEKAEEEGEGEPKKKEKEESQSLEDNRCHLIWEGALRDREFSAFKARSCPTDREAREVLGDRLKGYWDVAKNWKAEEEELY